MDTKETLTVADLVGAGTDLDFYRLSNFWREGRIDASDSLGHYENADAESADLVSHHMLGGSDYSGGSLVKSNREVFASMLGEFTDRYLVELHGGYGTEILALRMREPIDSEEAETTLRQAVESMFGLSDYCVMDDMHYSGTEIEAQAETFDSCYSSDWARALADRFPNRDDVEIDSEKATALFWESEPEWSDSDSGPDLCSDLDRIAGRYSPEYLLSAGVATIEADGILDTVAALQSEERVDREQAESDLQDWIRIRNGAKVLDSIRRYALRKIGKDRSYSIDEALRTHVHGDSFTEHKFWRYGPGYSRIECVVKGNGYSTDEEPFLRMFSTD